MISWERFMDILTLHRQGLSLREIYDKLGIHRTTATKYINQGQAPKYSMVNRKASIIDPYVQLIEEWLPRTTTGPVGSSNSEPGVGYRTRVMGLQRFSDTLCGAETTCLPNPCRKIVTCSVAKFIAVTDCSIYSGILRSMSAIHTRAYTPCIEFIARVYRAKFCVYKQHSAAYPVVVFFPYFSTS